MSEAPTFETVAESLGDLLATIEGLAAKSLAFEKDAAARGVDLGGGVSNALGESAAKAREIIADVRKCQSSGPVWLVGSRLQ